MANDKPAKSDNQLLGDRRNKLKRLRDEFGLDPYGQRIDGLISLADARAQFDPAADEAIKAARAEESDNDPTDTRPVVAVAGRVVQHRVMGNLIFMSLRDHTGDLQVAVSKKTVGQPDFGLAKMTDYGDLVTARGALGTTKTGEVTVWAGEGFEVSEDSPSYRITTKSLALPPGKHHGLTDPETRYRKRYVDLYSNPKVMETMQLRIRIIDEIRDYLRAKGFMEVETPMLQSIHGGAAARPFKTHHNALDLLLTLRIAPELYLKRLLVGGMPKVFEINRNFRNEGISPRHNPEFTMLEAYEAYGNWETMAELVEDMTCTVAEKLFGTLHIEHGTKKPPMPSAVSEDSEDSGNSDNAKTPSRQDAKKVINLEGDLSMPRGQRWRRVSMADLVEERTGWKFDKGCVLRGSIRGLTALFRCFANCKHDNTIDSAFALLFATEAIPAKILNDDEIANITALVSEFGGDEAIDTLISDNEKFEQEVMAKGTVAFPAWLKEMSPAEQLTEVYEKLIEPTLIDPTFVTRVPSVIIPLAKKCADDDYFADVYELAINGVEISPGYTELNDPQVQEANFREQVGDEEEQQQIDEDFLEALRVGMPPAGGLGLGIDRLVMMLTGAESIRDVILFPLMRPQG